MKNKLTHGEKTLYHLLDGTLVSIPVFDDFNTGITPQLNPITEEYQTIYEEDEDLIREGYFKEEDLYMDESLQHLKFHNEAYDKLIHNLPEINFNEIPDSQVMYHHVVDESYKQPSYTITSTGINKGTILELFGYKPNQGHLYTEDHILTMLKEHFKGYTENENSKRVVKKVSK